MKSRLEQSELRKLSYPLYLCTSFAPLNNQPFLQDILSLSCYLTEAVSQPSEKMLKAIRVQWWLDCIKECHRKNSPLSDRIILRIEKGYINKENLLLIIEAFQQSIFKENPEQGVRRCWGLVFEYYYFSTDGKENESIQILGSLIGELICNPQFRKFNMLEDDFIQIDSISTQDGFIKSCKYLVHLYKKNKLENFTLLPIRLFTYVLLRR